MLQQSLSRPFLRVTTRAALALSSSCRRVRSSTKPSAACRSFSEAAETTLCIPRVFSDRFGATHFDEIHVLLKDKEGKGAAGIGQLSESVPSSGVKFRRTPGDYFFDWHQAPTEQFIINLDADVEVTVTDGTSRVLRAGEVFYVEDTNESAGHRSQAVDGKDRHSVFIPTPKETLLPHLVPAPLQYGHLDLRVGVIQSVERHPDADALYVEQIDVGDGADGGAGEPRQIISGLVPFFPPEALLGRRVVVMCNLPKAKLRGVASHGMILCASAPASESALDPVASGVGFNAEQGQAVGFVEPPEGALPGDKVVVDNQLNELLYGSPLSANQMKKQQKHVIAGFLQDCRTSNVVWEGDRDGDHHSDAVPRFTATVAGIPLVTEAGPCTVAALQGAAIH